MTRELILGLCFATGVAIASAQTPVSPASEAAPNRADAPTGPGTRNSMFATIRGNALDSTNGALPEALVRLRDARRGRIVSTQITDKLGVFQFLGVDPGNYVVELLAQDTVLAASQLLSVNAGDAVSAVVKLPFQPRPLGGLLGHSISQAVAVASAAAAVGVLNVATTTDVSSDGTN